MPIRLNLLAEQQAEAEMRRRDPVKLALKIAAVLVLIMGAWAGWLAYQGFQTAAEVAAEEAKLKKVDKEFKAATEDRKKIAEVEGKLAALDKLATNRFLWAPALDALQHTLVENIQLTRFRVDQSYVVTDAVKPADRKLPAKPAAATEKILLRLEGRDYGRDTDQTYNKFKERLMADPFFKERLSKENAAHFSGISQPVADKDDPAKSYLTFTLECVFPDKVR